MQFLFDAAAVALGRINADLKVLCNCLVCEASANQTGDSAFLAGQLAAFIIRQVDSRKIYMAKRSLNCFGNDARSKRNLSKPNFVIAVRRVRHPLAACVKYRDTARYRCEICRSV